MKVILRILFIGLLTTPAYADDPAAKPKVNEPTHPDAAKREKLSETELHVAAHYHQLNQTEIALGNVAKKNSGSQAVKEYGEMLAAEHTASDKKLMNLAKQTKQAIPAEKPATDAEKQQMADTKQKAAALKKLKGADFDREYLQMMIDGHDRELAMIDSKMADVQNSELADQLRATKPMLQKHADQARELQKNKAQASLQHDHK